MNFDPIQRIVLARRGLFILALAGLFVSTYLFIVYTSGGPIVCGAGSHGCDAVRVSPWAHLFGLPTPLYGMAFYAGMAGLIVLRTIQPMFLIRWMYRLTMIGATVGLIESGYLTFIQIFAIGQFCTWCLASAVVATLMFVISWFDQPRHLETVFMSRELKIQFFAVLISVIAGSIAIFILTAKPTDGELPSLQSYKPSTEEVAVLRARIQPDDISYDGPSSSTVTVVEFVDFECPACRVFHAELQKAMDASDGKIRFAYRMFPLPMHADAMPSAIAAMCADAQGALYPYAESLMEEDGLSREALVQRAAELRLDMDAFVPCLLATSTKDRVIRDMEDGDALGVRETPTLFVNETMIRGLPTADQLIEILKENQ